MKDYRLKTDDKQVSSSFKLKEIKKLWFYVSHQWIWLVIAIFSIFGSAVSGVGIPYFIALCIDSAIPNRDMEGLLRILLLTGFLAVFSLILGCVQAYVLGRLSQGFLYRLRSHLFAKLQELPQAFFTQNQTGDLLSRLNNDSDKMAQFFSSGINRWLSNCFTLVGILSFMLALSPVLSLALLAVSGVTVWLTQNLSRLSRSLSRTSLATLGNFSAVVNESLSSFKAVILFNKKEEFLDTLHAVNLANAKASFYASCVSGIFSFIYTILGNLTQVIVLGVGLFILGAGYVSMGILIGFLTYTQRFYAALGQLGTVWGEAQLAMAAWERLVVLLSLKTHLEKMEVSSPVHSDAPLLKIEQVTFGYESEQPILKDLNLSFEKGKTYAIVGPTGGGKSTTVALMARLVDPWQGVIRFNGKDLRSFYPHEMAQTIGVILQDPFIFEGTLADNLRYGNPSLDGQGESTLLKEIEKMGLLSILEALGGDLNRSLDERASRLSLGQKQLVSFTRAVLRRPQILILDEATANVDTLTERRLEEVLRSLSTTTTQIVIAHRLATVERADEVIFINRRYVRSGLSYAEALELVKGASLKS